MRHPRNKPSPEPWPESSGHPRVLIENPDRAVLWGYSEILREAGYEVATCAGPADGGAGRLRCPLLGGSLCPLVQGADVVLSSCDLRDSREILAAISSGGEPPIVFEVPGPAAADYRAVAGSATFLPVPVTESSLREAVAGALEGTARAA